MPPRFVTLLIIAGWLASSGWLFYRDLWPSLRPGEPPPFIIDLADEAQRQAFHTRWNVFRDNKEIGKLSTWVEYRETDDTFALKSKIDKLDGLHFFSVFQVQVKKMESTYRITRDGDLRDIKVEFAADVVYPLGRHHFEGDVDGRVEDRRFAPRFKLSSSAFPELDLKLEPVEVAARGSMLTPMHPVNRVLGLRAGKRWRMPLVDPLRDALASTAKEMFKGIGIAEGPGIRFLDAEVLNEPRLVEWGDREVPCLIIEYRGEDMVAHTWVRLGDGMVLRQEAKWHGDHLVLQRYKND